MYCNNLYVKAIISALVNSNNYNIYNILKKIVRYILEKKNCKIYKKSICEYKYWGY